MHTVYTTSVHAHCVHHQCTCTLCTPPVYMHTVYTTSVHAHCVHHQCTCTLCTPPVYMHIVYTTSVHYMNSIHRTLSVSVTLTSMREPRWVISSSSRWKSSFIWEEKEEEEEEGEGYIHTLCLYMTCTFTVYIYMYIPQFSRLGIQVSFAVYRGYGRVGTLHVPFFSFSILKATVLCSCISMQL